MANQFKAGAEGAGGVPGPALEFAAQLLEELGTIGKVASGITRASYSEEEQRAHELVAQVGVELGLEQRRDAALNLYLTLPGRDRRAPAVHAGSHLDSVPCGGRFDGTAGVIAGLSVLAGWRQAGYTPPVDATVMAIRAEESAWFPLSYVGSRAAFGLIGASDLAQQRSDTGRTLADHIDELGGDSAALAAGQVGLNPAAVGRFIEVHIEQGPVLVEAGEPLGLVTGIRGSFRYRHALVRGTYAHSGATPRSHRQDAVLALSKLITRFDAVCEIKEGEGYDVIATFGQVATDPERADFSKVAGEVRFSLDVRSLDPDTLRRAEAEFIEITREIEEISGVSFELGPRSTSDPAKLDCNLREQIRDAAHLLGLDPREMPCGAGHDAAVFAAHGVPTAMIFLRNANGSHNPDEHLDFEDLALGARLLALAIALPDAPSPLPERAR